MKLEDLFKKKIINMLPVNNEEGKLILYKNPQIYNLAKQAKEEGKQYFFVNNIPHYEYSLTLNEKQYQDLINNYKLVKKEGK